MKRIIAILLASMFIIMSLASCSDGEGKDTGTDAGTGTGTGTSADTTDDVMSQDEINEELKKLNVADYFTIGAYKGVEINDVKIEVTDEIIEDSIDQFLSEFATEYKLTESDKAEKGDTLTITYVGYIDEETDKFELGEKFTEATTGYDLTLGSGQFIPGFEDGLIGYSVGETVTVNVTFPDEYKNNEDLEGVKTKFEVKIRSGIRMINPEYTDELVAKETEYKTVEEHKAYLIEQLEEAAEYNAHQSKISAIWEKIKEGTTVIKYPEDILERTVASTTAQYESYAKQYGMTLDQFLSLYYGTTLDDFKKQVTDECQAYILEEMLLMKIIADESLELNDREYNEGAKEYAEKFGMKDVAELEEEYGKDVVFENIQWDKVNDFLLENAVILPAVEAEEKE